MAFRDVRGDTTVVTLPGVVDGCSRTVLTAALEGELAMVEGRVVVGFVVVRVVVGFVVVRVVVAFVVVRVVVLVVDTVEGGVGWGVGLVLGEGRMVEAWVDSGGALVLCARELIWADVGTGPEWKLWHVKQQSTRTLSLVQWVTEVIWVRHQLK